ncbi:MAG: CoA transferase, partial [Acidimicrobiaceae bacterium]|nr:CoA transferase [Acidimicrobiaceae bacterium]
PERVTHRDELAEELSSTLRTGPSAHWLETLTEAGVPVTPIQTIDQVASHEQVRAIAAFQAVPHPEIDDLRLINTPIRVDGNHYPIRRPPPRLGEGGDEVLSELAARRTASAANPTAGAANPTPPSEPAEASRAR